MSPHKEWDMNKLVPSLLFAYLNTNIAMLLTIGLRQFQSGLRSLIPLFYTFTVAGNLAWGIKSEPTNFDQNPPVFPVLSQL